MKFRDYLPDKALEKSVLSTWQFGQVMDTSIRVFDFENIHECSPRKEKDELEIQRYRDGILVVVI